MLLINCDATLGRERKKRIKQTLSDEVLWNYIDSKRGGGSLFSVKLIISEGNMLLSYFNHCPAIRELRERPSFTTSNCCRRMRSSTLRARKHRQEKWSRHLLLVFLLRVPFIAYQFSLLFPYHSSHHWPSLVPAATRMPLGSFYFTALTSLARVVLTRHTSCP